MLKNLSDLSDAHEYVLLWTGQSTGRPWGTLAEAAALYQEIDLDDVGLTLASISIPSATTPARGAGDIEYLKLDTAVTAGEWNNATIRLGTVTALLPGYGTVKSTGTTAAFAVTFDETLDEIVFPSAHNLKVGMPVIFSGASLPVELTAGAFTYFVREVISTTRITLKIEPFGAGLVVFSAGSGSVVATPWVRVQWTVPAGTAAQTAIGAYMMRDDFKWASYPQVRVLTPYQPVPNPLDGVEDTISRNVPFPGTATTYTLNGRGLQLLAPYVVPAAVTSFEDLGLFLDFTFQEGIAGYGISEIADSAGATAHGITGIASGVWTFSNALPTADRTATVTFTAGTPIGIVNLASHGLAVGEPVRFSLSGGTLPAELTAGVTYYVQAILSSGTFSVSATSGGAVISFAGVGTPTVVMTYCRNALNGGRLIVDWEDAGVMKRSWATIVGSTTLTFVTGSWGGAGSIPDSGGAAKVKRYTAWVPHFLDNPHSYTAGEGFTYPNNDMQPCYKGAAFGRGAVIRNRPRGAAATNYGDQFGSMLIVASRLSAAIGKRVNVVMLSVNASGLAPVNTNNLFGFDGIVGWWDHRKHLTWAPVLSTSIYQRLAKLLTTIAPNALVAEGNTKTLRVLAHVHCQGETDALAKHTRPSYGTALRSFVTTVRTLITTLGFNPYSNGAKIPFLQPKIGQIPYCLEGVYTYYGITQTFDGDVLQLVNDAIVDHAISDGFGDYIECDDLPRILTDPGHFNGTGEAARATRIGAALEPLIDRTLAVGSTALLTTQTSVINLCNIALGHIGQAAITSLDDGSTQAGLCRIYLPESRDNLLQARQWSFAKQRVALTRVNRKSNPLTSQFDYCYAVPFDALNAFAVLPPYDGVAEFDIFRTLEAGYSVEFITNGGQAEPQDETNGGSEKEPEGARYILEQSPLGGRLLYTNQAQATLRYVRRVLDPDVCPPAFLTAWGWYLASLLASATIKGDQGEAVADRCMKKASAAAALAASSDAQQQSPVRPFDQIPSHMQDR